jgi:hypothetical protein
MNAQESWLKLVYKKAAKAKYIRESSSPVINTVSPYSLAIFHQKVIFVNLF